MPVYAEPIRQLAANDPRPAARAGAANVAGIAPRGDSVPAWCSAAQAALSA
jgi:hypothetical protein